MHEIPLELNVSKERKNENKHINERLFPGGFNAKYESCLCTELNIVALFALILRNK